MKYLFTTLGVHVVMIFIFATIYWKIYDGHNFTHKENMESPKFLNFLFYSITTQSGVGMPYISPSTDAVKMVAALQQFLVLVVITGTIRMFTSP